MRTATTRRLKQHKFARAQTQTHAHSDTQTQTHNTYFKLYRPRGTRYRPARAPPPGPLGPAAKPEPRRRCTTAVAPLHVSDIDRHLSLRLSLSTRVCVRARVSLCVRACVRSRACECVLVTGILSRGRSLYEPRVSLAAAVDPLPASSVRARGRARGRVLVSHPSVCGCASTPRHSPRQLRHST